MNKAISELRQIGILTQEKDKRYRVSYELYKQYRDFSSSQGTSTEDIVGGVVQAIKGIVKSFPVKLSEGKSRDVRSWIDEWNFFKVKQSKAHVTGRTLNLPILTLKVSSKGQSKMNFSSG